MTPRGLSLRDRFDRYVSRAGPACWLWTGHRLKAGYGVIQVGGRARMAHRVAFELTHGEIPPGQFVCHSCDNPACVNVEHLFLGSPADNVRDMDAKGRRANIKGEKNHQAKLKAQDVALVRFLADCGVKHSRLGPLFGVARTTVGLISQRKRWAHVPDLEVTV